MNDFTASNGITIYVRDGGAVQFQHGSREESCGILQIFPHSEWWQTLREFFQAEADERLGRWRHGDFVVYDRGDYVQVIHEPDGASGMLGSWTRAEVSGDRVMGSGFRDAARAYFDAHPEPKPWFEASLGEVWEVAKRNEETALYVVENSGKRFLHVERRLLALDIGDPDIVSARRIWPEVAA